MTQQRLAHRGRENVGDDPHSGHNGDVNLRVAKEPEQVLPEQRRSTGVRLELAVEDEIARHEKAGSGHVIEDQQNAGRHQDRESGQAHDRGDEPSPYAASS